MSIDKLDPQAVRVNTNSDKVAGQRLISTRGPCSIWYRLFDL